MEQSSRDYKEYSLCFWKAYTAELGKVQTPFSKHNKMFTRQCSGQVINANAHIQHNTGENA